MHIVNNVCLYACYTVKIYKNLNFFFQTGGRVGPRSAFVIKYVLSGFSIIWNLTAEETA